jgi:hypothetical protein
MFRAALIQPTKGLKNTYTAYKVINPIIPLLRKIFPKYITTLQEIGLAMIEATINGYDKEIIEVHDIVSLANKQTS